FTYAFTETVPQLVAAFKPDIVVSQLGVDTFRNDPLAHLNITTNGFCRVVGMIKSIAPKWVALGGGGYDIGNVARAWTLAWAIMNNITLPDELPEAFLEQYPLEGFRSRKLRDEEYQEKGPRKEIMRDEVGKVIAGIREKVFPLINPPA
ncbi:MAG TPA: acetoin utilization protein AcuC, partial [Nitrospiraceae bacterium]|nr:acetoin utilization protein AcuC [Nitrospiraceae bacterium]